MDRQSRPKENLTYLGIKLELHLSFTAHLQTVRTTSYQLTLTVHTKAQTPHLQGDIQTFTSIWSTTVTLPILHSPEETTAVPEQYSHEDM